MSLQSPQMKTCLGAFGTRTNSLGFAKNDCHTCAAVSRRCDRRRPRCGTCETAKEKCAGFAVDLVWKTPRSENRKIDVQFDSKTPHSSKSEQNGSKFKFVNGTARRKRKTGGRTTNRGRPSTLPNSDPLLFSKFRLEPDPPSSKPAAVSSPPLNLPSPDGSFQWSEVPVDFGDTLDDTTVDIISEECLLSSFDDEVGAQPSQSNELQIHFNADAGFECMDDFEQVINTTTHDQAMDTFLEIPNAILYRDLAHKYYNILSMYDLEFCVLPLSIDCASNPFRVHIDYITKFPFLLHAVLALSLQHMSRKNKSVEIVSEMQNHWSTALQLFSSALSNYNCLSLVDTVLILVNIEMAQGAYATVDMHLCGAQKLLEELGGVALCRESSRFRAQVAMLIWWDVTVAVISRREPRLALSYVDSLIGYDENDGWSFLSLNGCPTEFVVAMAKLAKLAAIYEQTTRMECTIFETSAVDEVVKQVADYVNKEKVELDNISSDSQAINSCQNRYHCVEAWRHAVLLYARRVFYPKPNEQQICAIDYLSRIILDNVRCIPPSDSFQKQLLLPVFLAASEINDRRNRAFVKEYCVHWSNTSHYGQFDGVLALLEGIWDDWSPETRDTYWWGSKIGHAGWSESGKDQGLVMRLLLG